MDKDVSPTLRLYFKDLAMSDAPRLFAIYSNAEAMKYRGTAPLTTIDEAIAFIQNVQHDPNNLQLIRKAIWHKKDHQLIGTYTLKYKKADAHTVEIGYSIDEHYWNQGLGKEIVNSLVSFLHALPYIHKITAKSKRENIGSHKILLYNGFIKNSPSDADIIEYSRLLEH